MCRWKSRAPAATKKAEPIARSGRLLVLAPLVKARKGFHTDVARWAVRQGFESCCRWEVDEGGRISKARPLPRAHHRRGRRRAFVAGARAGAISKRALEIGKGTAKVLDAKNRAHVLSTEMSCPGCGASFEELDPRLFSFNSPHGWCAECHGFGEVWKANPTGTDDPSDSAIENEMAQERQHEWLDEGEATPCPSAAARGLNRDRAARAAAGADDRRIHRAAGARRCTLLEKLKFSRPAADRAGHRAGDRAAAGVHGQGGARLPRAQPLGEDVERRRIQRIRLAAQLGSNLRGVLYVLDEPTIGLHARDNVALLDTLEALKRKGQFAGRRRA